MNSKEHEVMEPVAWMDIDEKGFGYGLRYWSEPDNRHEVPLYTTPPQRTAAGGEDTHRAWVGLTEKEILECRSANHLYFYKAIEAKLKAKNERKEKNTHE